MSWVGETDGKETYEGKGEDNPQRGIGAREEANEGPKGAVWVGGL